jgi:hypothetical protein
MASLGPAAPDPPTQPCSTRLFPPPPQPPNPTPSPLTPPQAGKYPHLFYCLAAAMKPRMLLTLDEEGALLPAQVGVAPPAGSGGGGAEESARPRAPHLSRSRGCKCRASQLPAPIPPRGRSLPPPPAPLPATPPPDHARAPACSM